MIYINECTDCGFTWDDSGHQYWYLMDVERADPELSIEPVLCDDCFRVPSRARAHAVSLSSTPNLKDQPVCLNCGVLLGRTCNQQFVIDDQNNGEGGNFDQPKHDAGDNSEVVSHSQDNDIQKRRFADKESFLDRLISDWRKDRQSKGNHQDD